MHDGYDDAIALVNNCRDIRDENSVRIWNIDLSDKRTADDIMELLVSKFKVNNNNGELMDILEIVKSELGSPVINVELTDDQINYQIEKAKW